MSQYKAFDNFLRDYDSGEFENIGDAIESFKGRCKEKGTYFIFKCENDGSFSSVRKIIIN